MHKPLYAGSNTVDAESCLRNVLGMDTAWSAVMLLDEWDVFLRNRYTSGLEHNAINADFLRKLSTFTDSLLCQSQHICDYIFLEYYQSTLIMTTNRIDAIDRTSKSYIHLTLRYPRTRAEAKAAIWRQFIQNTKWFPGNTLTFDHYQRLVALQLNGYDIKDVLKMMNGVIAGVAEGGRRSGLSAWDTTMEEGCL
ncbi:hypothetical protein PG987_007444 [Apiospora arundinis]